MSWGYDTFNEARGLLADTAWRWMFRYSGGLRSSKYLPGRLKSSFANRFALQERAEIALTVAGMYPGGDYFEFGSEGFHTLRNFLTAFDINGLGTKLPSTRFFAFDVFGNVDSGRGVPEGESWYYDRYRGDSHYQSAESRLRRHGLLLDRCELIKGYFEETLNDNFRSRLQSENRSIGFAFLDCNISSSYRTCFEFLPDFIRTDRAFVYMDEFFLTLDVPEMFENFCSVVRQRHGLVARYVRNAGSFGALFILMQSGDG